MAVGDWFRQPGPPSSELYFEIVHHDDGSPLTIHKFRFSRERGGVDGPEELRLSERDWLELVAHNALVRIDRSAVPFLMTL